MSRLGVSSQAAGSGVTLKSPCLVVSPDRHHQLVAPSRRVSVLGGGLGGHPQSPCLVVSPDRHHQLVAPSRGSLSSQAAGSGATLSLLVSWVPPDRHHQLVAAVQEPVHVGRRPDRLLVNVCDDVPRLQAASDDGHGSGEALDTAHMTA